MNTNTSARRSVPRQRGRKPVGERALTPAERMAKTRARRKQQGIESFMLTLGAPYLELLRNMALVSGESRTEVLKRIVETALLQVIIALNTGTAMLDAGESDDEVQATMQSLLGAELPESAREHLPRIREQFRESMKDRK